MADQVGDILGALAQRRQAKRHHIEPKIQILAEQALLDQDAQILVGGGDDPHVGFDRGAAAHSRIFALLEHPQQSRLRLHRHVADLVEEQGAAFGLLEPPGIARVGSREGALLVAKQFGLDELARDRRHVDGDERPGPPLSVVVQRVRHQFLAGARFPGDQHGEVGLHQPRQQTVDFLHRGRPADQGDVDLLRLARCCRGAVLRLRQRPADDRGQFLEVERLRQILIGAALRGADRGHEGVLGAHDDDRQVGPQLLDARQEIEGVLVGHDHIGDDKVALALAYPPPQGGGISG